MKQLTNLEKALLLFTKAEFTSDDSYKITNEFEIEWSGDGELFFVTRHYLDWDVGYVTDDDVFRGDFDQCLSYIINEVNEPLEGDYDSIR